MKNTETENNLLFYTAFIILTVFRLSFAGFFYTPYLDDYVQYLYYPRFSSPFFEILFGGAGTAFTRPIAAILDIYFWSKFFVFPGAAVILISVLFALSGIFFYFVLKKQRLISSPLFLIFYALLPSLSEGTYWISAAVRIVPGLFFTSVALYFMTKGKKALFLLFSLLSHGFYEQVSILFFCAGLLIFLFAPNKYYKEFILLCLSVLVITAYYFLFGKMGDNSERLCIDPKLFLNLKNNLVLLFELFFSKQTPLYVRGFLRGINLIKQTGSFLWLTSLFLICIFMFIFFPSEKGFSFSKKRLITGLILFIAPAVPFLILKDSWLNFRNIVPSVLGFSIISDEIFSVISKTKVKYIAVLLSIYLCICNVSEVWDYQKTAMHDQKIIYEIAGSYTGSSPLYYNKKSVVYLEQNSPYHDHIMSITGSDWGLTGTVRAVLNNRTVTVEAK